MSNFLLELTVEEIPSRMQAAAASEFERLMAEEFARLHIGCGNLRCRVSPRRIVATAELDSVTEEFFEEKKGPQITAPAEVKEKFLKANCASPADCREKEVGGKVFLFLVIRHPARNVAEAIGEAIKNAVGRIQWKKSMRWGTRRFSFVRPLRHIMIIFNGVPLKINFEEIGLESRAFTFGHRFLAPGKIFITDPEKYSEIMRKAFVIIDREERKRIILDGIKKYETLLGVSVEADEKLTEETAGLAEYPTVLSGRIPDKFMKLPEEVLAAPMKVHQRYFSTKIDGKPAPRFLFVADNIAADGGKMIVAGNERVLNARLADALFFFETDLKKPLESRAEELKKIAFNEKLGSVFDRVGRVTAVCKCLCEELKKTAGDFIGENTERLLKRAAFLAKCDLSCGMVGEFAELQGVMGGHYARIQGEDPEVCDAVSDQYLPADEITRKLSALLSLADKIEIITSFFAVGKEPTGSKDPFALRRAAIGILKIIKNFEPEFNLKNVIRTALEQLPSTNPNVVERVCDFIADRLRVLLKESGIGHEVVNSVVNDENSVLTIFRKAVTLDTFFRTESGEKLLSAHRRLKNIIMSNRETVTDEKLAVAEEEIALLRSIEELEQTFSETEKGPGTFAEKLTRQLSACAKTEKSLINFFDKVLVNAEDEKIRQNRLNILTRLSRIFDSVTSTEF
ncbi:MAG: glycine--tRNA ligase subunit beta [Holosporaceae bacterium]|jgi:glycyl-tRNA synthetase beta chain|nr:glycine--tRNA ligase subunit beta [Holosporaceae bacterium]